MDKEEVGIDDFPDIGSGTTVAPLVHQLVNLIAAQREGKRTPVLVSTGAIAVRGMPLRYSQVATRRSRVSTLPSLTSVSSISILPSTLVYLVMFTFLSSSA